MERYSTTFSYCEVGKPVLHPEGFDKKVCLCTKYTYYKYRAN